MYRICRLSVCSLLSCSALLFSTHLFAADIATSGGGLIVVGEGRSGPGVTVQSNLANTGGATAFALDELGGFGHFTAEVNDSIYGNANSWIGNGATGASGQFSGISLPASNTLNRFAFGRSNDMSADPCPGGCSDRNLGLYTLQFRNDGSTADDGGWSTIGTINYTGTPTPPPPFNATPAAP